MAGFMSGFGEAFSKSFSQASSQRAEREDELFRIKFTQFTQDAEKYKTTKAEQDRAAKMAKELAIEGGQPESAAWLYDRILTFGADDTAKLVRSGRLTKLPQQQTELDPKQRDVAQEMDQMFNSLNPKVEEPQASTPLWRDKTEDRVNARLDEATGGSFSTMAKQMSQETSSPFQGSSTGGQQWTFMPEQKEPEEIKVGTLDQANYEILLAEQTGNAALKAKAELRKEALKQTLFEEWLMDPSRAPSEGGMFLIRNPETGQSTMTWGKVMRDENGEDYILSGKDGVRATDYRQVTEQELKERSDLFRSLEKPVQVHNDKTAAVLEFLETSGRLFDIVEQDDKILSAAANVTERVASTLRDLEAGIDFAGRIFAPDEVDGLGSGPQLTPQQIADLDKVEEQLVSLTSPAIQDISERRAAFNALINIAAYKAARMEGQEGHSASDTDIKKFLTIVGEENDVNKFKNAIAGTVNIYINGLRTSKSVIVQGSTRLNTFERDYKWRPVELDPLDIDDMIQQSTSPFVKKAAEIVAPGQTQTRITEPGEQPEAKQAPTSNTVVSPSGKVYKPSMSPENAAKQVINSGGQGAEFFRQAYGDELYKQLVEPFLNKTNSE